jgi:hypothetical protein
MEQNVFKIKKAFLLPFMAIIVLLCLLLGLSLYKGQSWERIILAVAFIGTLLVGIESAQRKISITKDGLTVKKFFRLKNITWPEITHFGLVVLNQKAYFLLTTTRGFYFFSNMYENHALLIRAIMDKLEPEKVEIEAHNYLEHPVERRFLTALCWVTVFIIIAFIAVKLFSV